MSEIIFYALAALTIGSAFWVVTSKNLIYSAVWLFVTLFGIAGLYIFLYADFIAATQVLIYVGGVLVLIIFGVMLTSKIDTATISQSSKGKFLGAVLGLFIFGMMLTVILNTNWKIGELQSVDSTVNTIGKMILNEYLLPFEVVSVLLLGALIGAAMLSRKK